MKFLSAIKLILTLHCDQSTRLVSEGLDRHLTFAERWAIRLHRIGCWSCRRFAHQLRFIRQAAQASGHAPPAASHQLPAETRARILEAIRRHGEENV